MATKICKTHRRRDCSTCKQRSTTSNPYDDSALWLTTAVATGMFDSGSSSCDTSSYSGSSDCGSS